MYVEKNGYIIMQTEEMNFYGADCDFVEDIEDATVYQDFSHCEQDLKDLIEEFGEYFEILNYHKTIWIDKMGLQNTKTTIETCNCKCKHKNDIDDFGIPSSVLDEVAKQQMTFGSLAEAVKGE